METTKNPFGQWSNLERFDKLDFNALMSVAMATL